MFQMSKTEPIIIKHLVQDEGVVAGHYHIKHINRSHFVEVPVHFEGLGFVSARFFGKEAERFVEKVEYAPDHGKGIRLFFNGEIKKHDKAKGLLVQFFAE